MSDPTTAPCSSAQRRLWFLQQLAPASGPAYNIEAAFRITGELDLTALTEALRALMERQQALRTRIVAPDGEPRQEVTDQLDPPVRTLPAPAGGDPEQLRELVRQVLAEPFDPAQAPLWRVVVVTCGPGEQILAVSASHLICDSWSLGLFFDELADLYAAHRARRPFTPAPLAWQYVDYAAWEQSRRDDPAARAELDRWAEELADAPTTSPPGDLPRPAIQRFAGRRLRLPIPSELAEAVGAASHRLGATASMLYLAAYQALLARYTGQPEVLLGMPVAGRDRLELEPVIGFFAGTAPVRLALTGDPTGPELVAAARAATQRALRHQRLPFEELVERLAPDRDPSINPVFQCFFAYQNAPNRGLRLAELAAERFPVAFGTSKFDLTLEVFAAGAGSAGGPAGSYCDLEYNRDLYLPATIERLASHYLQALRWLTSEDPRGLWRFPLATDAEPARLREFSTGPADQSEPATLDALIARQIAATPAAPCLISEDGALDYRLLGRRATQLAHQLRRHGAGPDRLVAVCLPRSAAQVVALVGAVTAGAAYLPLDPAHPPERTRTILQQAQPAVVVTSASLATGLPVDPDTAVVILDDLAALESQPAERDWPSPHPDQLAYAIFTSGSTGTPKGVMISHRAIGARLSWMQQHYRLTPADRVLQKTPATFDVSVWEYFWPLVTGAQLVVAAPGAHRDPVALAATLADHQVSVAHFVPTMLAEFLASDPPALPSLRAVFSSGEALDPALAQRFLDRYPADLHNLYGPTEAAVDVTYHHCRRPGEQLNVPIGRPVPGTTAHVRDAWGEPTPIGVPGELYLGGVQLARGYLGRPDLTAAAFVPDPYADQPGARLYRTGDRARWRDDGELEYLGRIDDQVKIRGQRIELGEIESVLRSHPEVADAVAIVRDLPDRPQALVGYATLRPAAASPDSASPAGGTEAWQEVWEHLYSGAEPAAAPYAGWVSSYTGEQIPDESMTRFVAATVTRLRSLGGRRLLELGAGSGLLLTRLAPDCDRYWATDLSGAAIKALTGRVADDPALADRVRLWHREASDLADFPAGHFDGVILNSVVQYFPSADYLAQVIRQALTLVRAGGYLFVGDLRSARLLPLFHTSVQAYKAPGDLATATLATRVREAIEDERELAVDPAFFAAVAAGAGEEVFIGHALRAEGGDTEMSRFRYDLVLRKGRAVRDSPVDTGVADPTTLLDRVGRFGPGSDQLPWRQEGVPNARTAPAAGLAAALATEAPARVVGELRAALAPGGVEPDRLREVATERGLAAAVGFSETGPPGSFDLLLRRPGPDDWLLPVTRSASSGAPATNDPRRAHRRRRVEQELRTLLGQRLPSSMVPAFLSFLDSLPVTVSGKVDRRRLPAPRTRAAAGHGAYQPPRGELERAVAQVWSDLMGLDQVGRDDNFFALGGDSILAVQAVTRLRERGITAPLQVFFEASTIAAVAAASTVTAAGEAGPVPITAAQRGLLAPAARAAPPLLIRSTGRPRRSQASWLRALRALLRRQPALRLRWSVGASGEPQQQLAGPDRATATLARTEPDPSTAATLVWAESDHAVDPTAGVDVLTGPGLRLTVRDRPAAGTQDVLLAVDRLLVAPESVHRLGEELDRLLDPAASPEAASPEAAPPAAAEQQLRAGLATLAAGEPAATTPPAAAPPTAATAAAAPPEPASQTIDPALHRRLTVDAARRYRCEPTDLLAAALAALPGALPGAEAGPVAVLLTDDPDWPAGLAGPHLRRQPLRLDAAGRSVALLRSVKAQRRGDGPPHHPGQAPILLRVRRSAVAGAGWEYPAVPEPAALFDDHDLVVLVDISAAQTIVSVRGRREPAEALLTAYLAELAAVLALVSEDDADLYVEGDFPIGGLAAADLSWLAGRYPELTDVYPLTPFQRHAVGRLAAYPIDGLYATTFNYRLDGQPFDPAAFCRTWQTLMERHPALRTSFARLPGAGWRQLVHAAPPLPIDQQDLRHLPPPQREARYEALMHDARQHRSDLARAPQWQMTIVRMTDQDYRIVTRQTYALQDGWSFAVLQDEWFALYDAAVRGEDCPLPPPQPLRDHVGWLGRQDRAAARRHLRSALRDLPTAAGVLAAPRQRRRPEPPDAPNPDGGPPLAYDSTLIRLDRLLEQRMRAYTRTHRLTVFTLLAAAWAMTLADRAGQRRVAFGTVSSGRSPELPGSERIVGSLNNILPVVLEVPTEPADLAGWLHQLQHEHAATRAYDYASLPEVAEWLGAPDGEMLVDNFMVYENFPMRPGLYQQLMSWQPDSGETQTEHPLRLLIWPSTPLVIHASYYRDRFGRSAVDALLRELLDNMARLVTGERP